MRWFASYWITVLICALFALLYWLINADITGVSVAIDRSLPGGTPDWWLIPLLVSMVYLFVRVVLHRVLAYTESAIEASPRGDGSRGRRRAAIGNAAYTAFGNPTGPWLAPFALILGVITLLASLILWGLGSPSPVTRLVLSLLGLYAVTVASAMATPDRPQPLRRIEDEPELDPIMHLPGAEPVVPVATSGVHS